MCNYSYFPRIIASSLLALYCCLGCSKVLVFVHAYITLNVSMRFTHFMVHVIYELLIKSKVLFVFQDENFRSRTIKRIKAQFSVSYHATFIVSYRRFPSLVLSFQCNCCYVRLKNTYHRFYFLHVHIHMVHGTVKKSFP